LITIVSLWILSNSSFTSHLLLTNHKEQSFYSEANISSSTQKNSSVLWKLEVPCHVYQIVILVPIRSQRTKCAPYLYSALKFILILSSHLRLGLPGSLFPPDFPIRTMYSFLPHACYMSCPAVRVKWSKQILCEQKALRNGGLVWMYCGMPGVINRSYTRFPLSHAQISILWNIRNCTMEFPDNGATGNTSLVSKMTFSIILKTRTPHYIHTAFRELLLLAVSKRLCVHMRKKAVVVEMSCVYSVMYVFLRRWNKSFYLLVMCWTFLTVHSVNIFIPN
jgi:hypothetical protein